MTGVDLAKLMAELARTGVEPRTAFIDCQKAGMQHINREKFEAKYNEMVQSPLMRAWAVRQAQEEGFKTLLTQYCLSAMATPETVTGLMMALGAAQSDPRMIGTCLKTFEGFLATGYMDELKAAHAELWPESSGVDIAK